MSHTHKEMVDKVRHGEIRKEDIHIQGIPERIEQEDTEYTEFIEDAFDMEDEAQERTAVELILSDMAERGEIGCYHYGGKLYYGNRDEIKKFREELKTF